MTREAGREAVSGGPGIVDKQVRAPDPEVRELQHRRRFTTGYKLRVLEEADRCDPSGQLGALLRREGLYRSQLAQWRRQRAAGELDGGRRKRGAAERELRSKLRRTQRENERLTQRLAQTETIIDVQKKLSSLLGLALGGGEN